MNECLGGTTLSHNIVLNMDPFFVYEQYLSCVVCTSVNNAFILSSVATSEFRVQFTEIVLFAQHFVTSHVPLNLPQLFLTLIGLVHSPTTGKTVTCNSFRN